MFGDAQKVREKFVYHLKFLAKLKSVQKMVNYGSRVIKYNLRVKGYNLLMYRTILTVQYSAFLPI
jgi:hypothetical protein